MKQFLSIMLLLAVLCMAGLAMAADDKAPAATPAVTTEPAATPAPAANKIDTGDTAWMIVATALVMLMTLPGLALFYGGMSKGKNVLNTLAMSFVTFAIVSVLWVLYGYTFAFSTDV